MAPMCRRRCGRGFRGVDPEPGTTYAHHNGMEMIRFGAFAACPEQLCRPPQDLGVGRFKVALFDDIQQLVWKN